MSEHPKDEPLTDEDLDAAVGGELDGNPFPSGSGQGLSSDENNIGATSC